MNKRAIAAVGLGITIALGTSGCTLISPQATTISYSPAEGVTVPDTSGPLQVRNALIVADAEGTVGNFLAAIVNDTDEASALIIGFNGTSQTINVPARTTVSLGMDAAAPLAIPALGSAPGTNVEVTFQSGQGEAATVSVPVLDGTLPYLAEFVPAAPATPAG